MDQRQQANQAMQMIQQAKQLDREGKEADCMEMATKIKAQAVNEMAPPPPK
jgi:hypothetical protein